MDDSKTIIFEDMTLSAPLQKVLREASDLDDSMASQLQFLIESPYWWLDSIEDCFNKHHVDDGVLVYKEMQSQQICLYYWLGYFGGNPRGYVLMHTNDDGWKVLIENCDTDFIWRGEGPLPKAFMKQVKMAAYGDKYREEEDD
jgi:hypothetical protein